MNTTFFLTASCSCANQLLLAPGRICEICMGVVGEPSTEDREGSLYDVDYFEAIEEALSREDLAA